MKKLLKVLLVACILMGATTVSAEHLSEGKASSEDGLTSVTFDVKIESETNTPKTKFTYTVAPGTAVDATANTPKINAGPADGAKFAEGANAATFVVNDADKKETLTITLDPSKFTAAGIYRYTVTQADLTDAQTAIGLVADDAAVKYLDLYVENGETGKKITNVILSNNADAPTITPVEPL